MAVDSPLLTIWSRVQACAWIAALGWFAFADGAASASAYVVAGLGVSLLTLAMVLSVPRTIADWVTLARAVALVAGFAGPWWLGQLVWSVWLLLALAVAMDLVDGWIARRFGASERGAVFDMECDQLCVLALSLLVVAGGGSPHALALPAMRYAFVIAAWAAGIEANDPKPVEGDNRRGRLICAAVVIALLAATTPVTPALAADVLTGVATALLAWSFAGDWAFLFARRRAEVRP